MIVENSDIGSQSNQKTVDFELDNSGGHLFSVLSQLYSRPVDSTIRELATNCGDAHIMSNNIDRPFIIKLPNFKKDILTLCFRDFGPGLSHSEIMNIYRIYGKSTKTKSNDVTGCLGLGSKSPYSISSTFYVKSYKNGKCSQYTCSMDNNSIPNITEIPIITDTYNENGLEVIIPFYKEVDFHKILPDVLKYFKVKPIVYLQEGELEQDSLVNIKWHEIKDVFKLTKTISISNTIKKLSDLITFSTKSELIANEVIQLQIYYPLDKTLILDTIKRYNKLYTDESNTVIEKFHIDNDTVKIIGFLLKVGIQLHAGPGKIAFAPSRETIKYTDLTLIYIIKELIKAATIFKKIYIRTLSSLDSYEKIFKYIYLEADDYRLLANTFDVKKLKNIVTFSSIFERKVRPKMILGGIHPHNFKNALNEFRLEMDPIEKMDLYSFKSTFPNCFANGYTQRVLNIFDPTIKKVESGGSGKVIVVNGATPFLNSLIFETIKKVYFKMVQTVYNEVRVLIDELFDLSDMDFMKYSDTISVFKFFKLVQNDYKLYSKEEKVELKKLLIEKYEAWDYLEFVQAMCNLNVSSTNTKFGKMLALLNEYNNMFFSWQFINHSRDINTLSNHLPDIKHAKMVDILENYKIYNLGEIRYKDIIFYAGITFQKLHRCQLSAKNKFWTNIQATPFNFDNIVKEFVDYKYNEVDNLPLEGYAGLKKNDCRDIEIYVANVAMWIFYKYYRNEVEIQNQYYMKANVLELLKVELESFNILPEYLSPLKPVIKVLQTRSTGTRSMFKVQHGEMTDSSVWYHDELNDENMAYLHHEIYLRINKIKILLKNMVRISKEAHIWLLNSFDVSSPRSYYFGSAPHAVNHYMKRLMNISNELVIDNNPITENWNKTVSCLYGLIRIEKDICNDELKYCTEMRLLKEKSENLVDNKDNINNFNYQGNDFKLIRTEDDKIFISRYKEKFILLDNTMFKIPAELRGEFQTRLFEENKICILNSNLKIGFGLNPVPELIDLKELQSVCPDSKMRKAKNALYEDISFSDIDNILKIKFPDYIFLKFHDNFPTKLLKGAYNPLPLLIKLLTDSKLQDEILNLIFCYNNQQYGKLPITGFFKHTDNSRYEAGIKDKLKLEGPEFINYFRSNSISHVTSAFMIALGKKNNISFQTFEKILHTFGNEDIINEYHKLRDWNFSRYKACVLTCATHDGFDKVEDLTWKNLAKKVKSDTLSQLKLPAGFNPSNQSINTILKFYRLLKSFVENYTKHSKTFTGKLVDMNGFDNKYELEFRKILKDQSKLINLFDRVDTYCYNIERRGSVDVSQIKEDFLDYIKPTKTSQKDIIEFRTQDEFFQKLNKYKRTEILNKKINRRTTEALGKIRNKG